MIRVLIVEPAGALWGSERALIDMLESLHSINPAVCCPPASALQPELDRRCIKSFPFLIANLHRKSRMHRLLSAFGVLCACILFRPHVIHLNQSGAYRIALPAAVLLNLPIVAHVRLFEDAGYLAERRPDPRRLVRLVAVSQAIAAELSTYGALEPLRISHVYDGYRFHAPSPDPGLERLPFRMACLGRISSGKGFDLLAAALSSSEALPGGTECLIAGTGESGLLGDLGRTAPRSGTTVKWLGFVRDPLALLRTCAVLVCPSHREPLGRVILDAWEAGAVPVVYEGSGGAAEIVSAAGGGITYGEQSPEALGRALGEALRLDRQDSERLVENGRAWMRSACDAEAHGRAMADILHEAARTRRSASKAAAA